MHRTPSRGQGRYGPKTPNKTPMLKGLFADGIWNCNCEPRLPADHFQTKNGGPNHGRWFYTCQQPQPRRCGFFLWDSEAKAREATAVLANSRTEPVAVTEPNTPSKNSAASKSPITPYSTSKPPTLTDHGPTNKDTSGQSKAKRDDDWLYVSDDDFEDATLRRLVDQVGMPPPETPSKSVKRNEASSPGKRNYAEYQERSAVRPAYGKPTNDIELFNTPNEIRGRGLFADGQTGPQSRGTDRAGGLISPGVTPATNRFNAPRHVLDSSEKIPVTRDESPTARKSNLAAHPSLTDRLPSPPPPPRTIQKPPEMTPLATQILDALHDEQVDMTENMVNAVKAISLRHVTEFVKMQKGRDMCRERIKKQEGKITYLEGEVQRLSAQLAKK